MSTTSAELRTANIQEAHHHLLTEPLWFLWELAGFRIFRNLAYSKNMEAPDKTPFITFKKVRLDTVLMRRGEYPLETADFSRDGLAAFAIQHQQAILSHMELMEYQEGSFPDLDQMPPRPAIYLARMSIIQSEVLPERVVRRHLKQFNSPSHITADFVPYWTALKETDFSIFAGVIDKGSPFEGVWLGLQQPLRK